MPTCREISELSSQSLEVRHGLWRRIQMFLHCRMCGPCRTSVRNFRILRLAVRRTIERQVEASDDRLTEDSRQRMKLAIEAALQQSGDTSARR